VCHITQIDHNAVFPFKILLLFGVWLAPSEKKKKKRSLKISNNDISYKDDSFVSLLENLICKNKRVKKSLEKRSLDKQVKKSLENKKTPKKKNLQYFYRFFFFSLCKKSWRRGQLQLSYLSVIITAPTHRAPLMRGLDSGNRRSSLKTNRAIT
jgi:hypothetical protein